MHGDPGRPTRALALALAALALDGCSRPGRRQYPLAGVVQSQRPTTGEYVVAHEDIAGFMPAMTMPFRVERGAASVALMPGDRIAATLIVADNQSWLEDVTVVARGLPVKISGQGPPPAAAGEAIPDLELVNQDGKLIRLGQYRGRTLVLTFIYTRCPLPEFCPLMMRNFQQLDEALAADPALFAQTHLLSISFDPAHDTPEVLRGYGRSFVQERGQGRFSHWELATGSAVQVKAVAQLFGLEFWAEGGEIVHALRTAVIGPDGTLAKVYDGNLWTPQEALADIRRVAR